MFHSENTCKHAPVVHSVAAFFYVYFEINLVCGRFMAIYPIPSVEQNIFQGDWFQHIEADTKWATFEFRLILYRS